MTPFGSRVLCLVPELTRLNFQIKRFDATVYHRTDLIVTALTEGRLRVWRCDCGKFAMVFTMCARQSKTELKYKIYHEIKGF